MIIYNVKIYTMNEKKEIIHGGFVEINEGKITKIGKGYPEKITPEDINGEGGNLFPGFIDAHTHLGLTSAGVGTEGEDINEEFDPCTPHLRITDGINPMDYSFEQARKAGVTTVLISPGSSNPVAGSICAVKTLGKRIDKMSLGQVGIKFSMGENPKLTYMDNEQSPCTRMAVAASIREALLKAQRYMTDINSAETEEDLPEFDIKSQALVPLLEGKLTAHFHCHRADDIFTAIRIAKEFNLKYVLVHATDGYLIADELEEENCSAIVGPVICDRCKPEMANLSPANAGILSKKNVKVAICTDHSEVPIEYLPLSVGICIKNGMEFYKAVESVTCCAAQIGGISDRTGSIEVGKDGDIVLFGGNPFEVMSSPKMVMINGKVIDL